LQTATPGNEKKKGRMEFLVAENKQEITRLNSTNEKPTQARLSQRSLDFSTEFRKADIPRTGLLARVVQPKRRAALA
jgi:hypothetical protein